MGFQGVEAIVKRKTQNIIDFCALHFALDGINPPSSKIAKSLVDLGLLLFYTRFLPVVLRSCQNNLKAGHDGERGVSTER
jgi:hypothetical protein